MTFRPFAGRPCDFAPRGCKRDAEWIHGGTGAAMCDECLPSEEEEAREATRRLREMMAKERRKVSR